MNHLRGYKSKGLLSIYLATSSMVVGVALAASGAEHAQAAPAGEATQPGEIIVTASRRSESVTKLPFNISAYGSQQLQSANITSVTALSQQVPNFVITDAGPGRSAGSIPIIRGINASVATSGRPRFFQSPVGIYLGNTPMTGSLPLMDVERVEVLRGPQGTLYGAGALAGAVRIIPAEPKLGTVSGEASGSVQALGHSRRLSNDQLGIINLPVGENAAFRVVARREYDAGFIDQNDIMRRESGNPAYALPILADPNDVASSPAVYYNKKDVNYSGAYSTRASFVWKPDDKFKFLASYSYSHVKGDGTPTDNYTYGGGPSKIDPRRILAPTGEYEKSIPTLQPYSGDTHSASLDLSYDMGFATLSGTAAYGRTKFESTSDATIGHLGAGFVYPYYVGNPMNPRYVDLADSRNDETNYTQEVRLVSKAGGPIDYTVGAFFQQQKRFLAYTINLPGADTQSAAAHGGSMVPILEGGTWVGPFFANSVSFDQAANQNYRDYSVYGDVTWHISPSWQVTGGARFARQTFAQRMIILSSIFPYNIDAREEDKLSRAIFKANTSYRISPNAQLYATFSQGFRRGGANTFPTTGPLLEPAELQTYKPDATNNYEIGVKGRVRGISFAADLFYIDWKNVQIDTATPFNAWDTVINGSAAVSKGAEIELTGPIGESGFSFSLGLAYARARLTEDFALPAGGGAADIIPGAITGFKGARLPGAPDFSGSGNLYYKFDVGNDSAMTFNIGADYRGSVVNGLALPSRAADTMKGYALLRASVQLDVNKWQFQLFANNLADAHAVISKGARSAGSLRRTGAWGDNYLVTRPRQVGLRVTRNF